MTVAKPEKPPEKPKCPECETELVEVNGKMPEECAKCGFDLAGFPIFERMWNVIKKKEKPPEPEVIAQPRKKGLAGLLRKGK